MRLTEYYRGLPLNLTTRLPPEEAARRLNAALPSPFRPFATGIVGRARPGRVKLFYRGSLLGYNGMPILTGPMELHPRGTLLRLLYRGRLATRLAFPLAFVLAGLGVGVGVGAYLATGGGEAASALGPGFAAMMALALLVCLALPLAIHIFLIRNAEARLAIMADFLRRTLDATDA